MKRYKYKFSNSIVFFENKDLILLKKAALDGWHLKKINFFGFYKLEKGENKAIDYAIDVKRIKSGSEDFAEYLSIFESGGWRYVCSIDNTFHFFTASQGTTPIYTDSNNESLKYRLSARYVLRSIFIFLVVAIPMFTLSRLFLSPSLLRTLLYALSGALFGLTLAYLFAFIFNLIRAFATKRKEQNG